MTAAEPPSELTSRILESLGDRPARRQRPVLVVLSGLPGTGKSRLAQELRRRTGVVVLESDALRRLLSPRPTHSSAESRRLFLALHAAIDRLLDGGVSCLLDATNLLESHRRPLYEIAERRGARLILVRLTAAPADVRRRLASPSQPGRVSDADAAVYERMRRQEEPIERAHFLVDTSQDTTVLAEEIAAAITAGRRRGQRKSPPQRA